jgi:hypothetical protein
VSIMLEQRHVEGGGCREACAWCTAPTAVAPSLSLAASSRVTGGQQGHQQGPRVACCKHSWLEQGAIHCCSCLLQPRPGCWHTHLRSSGPNSQQLEGRLVLVDR